jgi:hypothetical protein
LKEIGMNTLGSALLLLLLLLSACAEVNYQQEGKTAKETEQDVFACENTILKEHQGLQDLTAKDKQVLMDNCMKEKGYSPKL